MPGGIPINRQWVLVTREGEYVIDWGDNLFQDIQSGDFLHVKDNEISHHVKDDELEWLKRINRVERFDSRVVYFFSLPERPQKTIE